MLQKSEVQMNCNTVSFISNIYAFASLSTPFTPFCISISLLPFSLVSLPFFSAAFCSGEGKHRNKSLSSQFDNLKHGYPSLLWLL